MVKGHLIDGKSIALIIAVFSIVASKSIKDPAKAALIGGWISVFGETLEAIADTQEYKEEKEEEKRKIKEEIDELQRRLKELDKW
ncbi:hypothetical protein RH915_06240 [Serpentinicella sp. ANB-PHB4]|uniref:hypothetical protein n=1 Tax=Serpentinicella sp. ANB-PHB4 TaxID=3074076 RepID=UPI00286407E3|nr:hypothetical protein [Serpentinicella sp. ANB-PHB4]MDR5659084.1 hypothetical protein [Serpentinicella sp. ANB-PHB4]